MGDRGFGQGVSLGGVAVNAQTAYRLEILSCYFEAPPKGCEQHLQIWTGVAWAQIGP